MRTCCKRYSAGCSSHRRQQLKARAPRRSEAVAIARKMRTMSAELPADTVAVKVT